MGANMGNGAGIVQLKTLTHSPTHCITLCIHTYTHIHIHTYIHVHTYIPTYTYTHIYIHTHRHTHRHIHRHTHRQTDMLTDSQTALFCRCLEIIGRIRTCWLCRCALAAPAETRLSRCHGDTRLSNLSSPGTLYHLRSIFP